MVDVRSPWSWTSCAVFLFLGASLCVTPLLGDVCYGWDDGCRKLNDAAATLALAGGILVTGLAGSILSRTAPRSAWIAALAHQAVVLALLVTCAQPLGRGTAGTRHDRSPTDSWSWANAYFYSEKRALALLALSSLLALIAGVASHRFASGGSAREPQP